MTRGKLTLAMATIGSVVALASSSRLSHAAEVPAAQPIADHEDSEEALHPGPPPCFDVAVVARLLEQTPTPVPPSTDWVVRWPWKLSLGVEQVLAGTEARQRLTVTHIMHVRYRSEVKRALLFLRRRPNDDYIVVGIELDVVRDRVGRFVMPLASPPWLPKDSLIPAEYERLMRPIRYAPSQAWWLRRSELKTVPVCVDSPTDYSKICTPPRADEPGARVKFDAYPWGKLRPGWMVAEQGLLVSDLVKADAKFRCPAPGGFTAGSQAPINLYYTIRLQ
jgi:hypothetical protein